LGLNQILTGRRLAQAATVGASLPLPGRFVRRPLFVAVAVGVLAVLTMSHVARAGGAPVLEDYRDDGQIQGCYTDAEFSAALRMAPADLALYGVALDLIEQRQLECASSGPPVLEPPNSVDAGTSNAWILGGFAIAGGIAGVVGLVFWRRRRVR